MSNDTCGHPTQGGDGPPCQNPATEGDHCWLKAHGGDTTNGRPSKLTKQIADKITQNIAEGKSDKASARLAGLHPTTIYNWLDHADNPKDVPLEPEFEADPHGYFFRRYTHAHGLSEDLYFGSALEMAMEQGDIATVISLGKQRHPDSWGDIKRSEQSGGVVIYTDEPETFEIDDETLEAKRE